VRHEDVARRRAGPGREHVVAGNAAEGQHGRKGRGQRGNGARNEQRQQQHDQRNAGVRHVEQRGRRDNANQKDEAGKTDREATRPCRKREGMILDLVAEPGQPLVEDVGNFLGAFAARQAGAGERL
jgi:hypothetical protein